MPGQVGEHDSLVMLRPTELAPGLYQPLPRPVAAGTDGWAPKAHKCARPQAPILARTPPAHIHALSLSTCVSWRKRPKPSQHRARSQDRTASRGA